MRREEADLLEQEAARLELEATPPAVRRVRGAGAMLEPGKGDAVIGGKLLGAAGLGRRRGND
jgi:hypothetical protein